MRKLIDANINLPAGGALQLVGEFDVTETDSVACDLKNTGANPLTGFEVWGRAHPAGDYTKLIDSGYTAAGWWSRWASAEPATLAAGANALVTITVEELSSVKIFAKAGSATQLRVAAVGWETAR